MANRPEFLESSGDDGGVAASLERARQKLKMAGARPRTRTLANTRLTAAERAAMEATADDPQVPRPVKKSDCRPCGSCQAWRDAGVARTCGHTELQALWRSRPCVFVACKSTLYLDVHPDTGAMKLNFPHLDPGEMTESCVEDIADRGGITLEELGSMLNLTRERIRQVEMMGLEAMKDAYPDTGVTEDRREIPPSLPERALGRTG